jgi:hypothetical protein
VEVKAINDRYRSPRAVLEKVTGMLRTRLSDYAAAISVHTSSRASRRRTCVAYQRRRPRGVGARRSLSASAMLFRLVILSAWSALMIGASFAALPWRFVSFAGGNVEPVGGRG